MREIKFRSWDKLFNRFLIFELNKNGLECLDPDIDDFILTPLDFEEYTGLKDANGKEIYEGDIVEYYFMYQDRSDAISCYGVEPQNNYQVNEIYPEIRKGTVNMVDGQWVIQTQYRDDLSLFRVADIFTEDLEDCLAENALGYTLKELAEDCRVMGMTSPIRRKHPPKVVGNVHETPELPSVEV